MSRVQTPTSRTAQSAAGAPACKWSQTSAERCSNRTWNPSGLCWVHQGRSSSSQTDRTPRRHTSDSVLSSRRSQGWSNQRDASVHLMRQRPALFMGEANNMMAPWQVSNANTNEVLWNGSMVSLPHDDGKVILEANRLKGGTTVKITPRVMPDEEFFENVYDMSKDLYSNVHSYNSGLMNAGMSESYPNATEALASLNLGRSRGLRIAYLPPMDSTGMEVVRIKGADGKAVTLNVGEGIMGTTRTSHLARYYEVKSIKSSDYPGDSVPEDVMETGRVVLAMRGKIETLGFRNAQDGSTMLPSGWQGEELPDIVALLSHGRR